jgi:nucleotide-binding universal stress UspA family protein
MLEGPLMADISGWLGAQPYGDQLQSFRELMEQKGQAVIEALAKRCESQGVKIETNLKMGHPSNVIIEEEGRVELLVLGRRGVHAEWIGDMMGSVSERVLRSTTTPCIITPDTFKPISKILAAYDGSGHAGQALQQAIELTKALKGELIILTVADDIEREQAEQLSVNGLKMAKAHDCTAVNLVAEGRAEETILEVAEEQECDLIVVGAYGHNRIREMIIGSTSHHIIAGSNLPVMLVR